MVDARRNDTPTNLTPEEVEELVSKADEMAEKAHEGQVDLAGQDYINHPRRVAAGLRGIEKIAALLHDVVEDTPNTLDDLTRAGFPAAVIEAVDALTKRPGEDYAAYIMRVKSNPTARRVKIEDLKDNMDLSRIPNPTAVDHQRTENYHRVLRELEQSP